MNWNSTRPLWKVCISIQTTPSSTSPQQVTITCTLYATRGINLALSPVPVSRGGLTWPLGKRPTCCLGYTTDSRTIDWPLSAAEWSKITYIHAHFQNKSKHGTPIPTHKHNTIAKQTAYQFLWCKIHCIHLRFQSSWALLLWPTSVIGCQRFVGPLLQLNEHERWTELWRDVRSFVSKYTLPVNSTSTSYQTVPSHAYSLTTKVKCNPPTYTPPPNSIQAKPNYWLSLQATDPRLQAHRVLPPHPLWWF